MTTVKYRIITSMDEEDFQNKVNEAISGGYTLLGGVSSRGAQLLQAVTKEEGEPSDNNNITPSEPEPDKVTTVTVSKASTKAKATTKVKTEKKEG